MCSSDLIYSKELQWPKCLKNHTLVRRRRSAYIRGFAEEKARMCSEISSVICTEVYVGLHVEGAYIRGISERKVCMQTRVCWSMGYEMSDLFCYVTAICILQFWVVCISLVVWLSLNVWSGSSLKIWWNVACKLCPKGSFGSSVKIDETWSIEVLRVVAFSQGVVAPFQVRLVNEIRGS